jgi:DNA repair exonuclease SbcCD ATPase subunit
MTLTTVLEQRRLRMSGLTPEASGGVIGAAITGLVGITTLWIRSRFNDRQDERQTLLAAYTESQRALNQLREHVSDLEGHLKDANVMIASLLSEAKQAAQEREQLRAAVRDQAEHLRAHGIECCDHCVLEDPKS